MITVGYVYRCKCWMAVHKNCRHRWALKLKWGGGCLLDSYGLGFGLSTGSCEHKFHKRRELLVLYYQLVNDSDPGIV